MSEQPIGTTEASVISGRHKRTIIAWIRKGLLSAQKLPGARGQYLIMRSELEKFIKDRYTPKEYVPKKGQQ